MRSLDFEGFDPTDFEEFCFRLLDGMDGVHNVDWRKGTPKKSSPADRGRDVVANIERVDVDQTKHFETWFVDCKHYTASAVPPDALQGLLAWAMAERPHVALAITSGFLSNGAKDYLRDYELNNRPPFRIKYWELTTLEKLADGNQDLIDRFLLGGVRTESEILDAEDRFFEQVWLDRHELIASKDEERKARGEQVRIPPVGHEKAEEVRARLGPENIGPYSDFEWGMINGKLSALRWVLGSEWDFLDT